MISFLHPQMRAQCLLRSVYSGMKLKSATNSSGVPVFLIFNSLIYPYSDEFISHVASKHAVWHLYFRDITRNHGFARK